MFSKACEYAIRATIFIARQSLEDKRSSLIDIAREIGSPVAFTSKILQQLVKANIIFSTRGQTGGFGIKKDILHSRTVAEVVSAIDGDSIYTNCGLGLKGCSGLKPCPVHEKFVTIREELKKTLESTTIEHLANGLKDGLTFLIR